MLSIQAFTASGERLAITLQTITPTILRLRMGSVQARFDDQSPMLVPLPEAYRGAAFQDAGAAYVLTSGGYRIELDKTPFCLRDLPGG